MQIAPINDIPALAPAAFSRVRGPSFGDALASAADALTSAVAKADADAASIATGHGNIAEAAVARAKADVMLEVAAIASARVSSAVTSLLQTQV